jgi:hypothetical protein
MSKLTLQNVIELMDETLLEDPIDFAGIPNDENDLKVLVAASMLENVELMLKDGMSKDEIIVSLLVSSSTLVLQNLAFNLRNLSKDNQHSSKDILDSLLKRIS